MKGTSLFSSIGIAETFFKNVGIDILVANELLKDRAKLYSQIYPRSKMISGNILDKNIFNNIINQTNENVDFLIASPPCQGMSVAGKNRNTKQMLMDERNYLVFKVIDFIKIKKPKFILIENVPTFFKLLLPFQKQLLNVVDILSINFKDKYIIEAQEYDTSLYGIPQKKNTCNY